MKLTNIVVVLVGLLLIVAAFVYFLEPARTLPQFFPGYDVNLTKHHYTHGLGTLILGLLCFVYVWFQSGKKSKKQE